MTKFFDHYRTLARAKNLTATDAAMRCIFKGFYSEDKTAEEFLKEAFTPIRKSTKLSNGARPYDAARTAVQYAKFYLIRQNQIDNFLSGEDRDKFVAYLDTVKAPQ
jgi:cytochrome c556